MENRLETNAPEKLWNASYIFALVVSTFTAFSFYMNQSMLAGYLQSDGIGLTAQLAGVIVGLFSMTSLFCRPFCGVLSDRMNNVKLLMVSNLLMTAGLAGFAFVKTAPLFFLRQTRRQAWMATHLGPPWVMKAQVRSSSSMAAPGKASDSMA